MDPNYLAENYVRKAYEDLAKSRNAEGQQSYPSSSSLQKFACVSNLVKQVAPNSLILDIGCGENAYGRSDIYTIGMELTHLSSAKRAKNNFELILADALNPPFRNNLFDAILLVSVIHHLPSEERRLKCLRKALSLALREKSVLIVVVWAKDQQPAQFPSNDVLVPYNLEDIAKLGYTNDIPFNKYTTREQRIILGSVPIRVNLPPKICCTNYLPKNVQKRLLEVAMRIGWLYPILDIAFYEHRFQQIAHFLIDRIGGEFKQIRDSLAVKKNSVQDSRVMICDFALRLSVSILGETFAHLRRIYRDVLKYRYYHVFASDELDFLFDQIRLSSSQSDFDFQLISSEFECGNWCRIVGIGNAS